jgi:hypothetical protein
MTMALLPMTMDLLPPLLSRGAGRVTTAPRLYGVQGRPGPAELGSQPPAEPAGLAAQAVPAEPAGLAALAVPAEPAGLAAMALPAVPAQHAVALPAGTARQAYPAAGFVKKAAVPGPCTTLPPHGARSDWERSLANPLLLPGACPRSSGHPRCTCCKGCTSSHAATRPKRKTWGTCPLGAGPAPLATALPSTR